MSLTIDALRRMNDAAEVGVTIRMPGDLIEDVDGRPAGMVPNVTTDAEVYAVYVARHEVDALGITPEQLAADFPNIHVIDPKEQ